MGYFYLLCALLVATFIAAFAPRAGLIFGAALLVIGSLPMLWMLAVKTAFGIQLSESDGMLLTIGLYYLSAPGLMLLVLSALFAASPWNR